MSDKLSIHCILLVLNKDAALDPPISDTEAADIRSTCDSEDYSPFFRVTLEADIGANVQTGASCQSAETGTPEV